MIIKFNQFINESLLDKLTGPSYDEIINNNNVNKLLKQSFCMLDEEGIKYAIERGADSKLIKELEKVKKWFLEIILNTKNENGVFRYYYKTLFNTKNKVLFQIKHSDNTILFVSEVLWYDFNIYDFTNDEIITYIKSMFKKYMNLDIIPKIWISK